MLTLEREWKMTQQGRGMGHDSEGVLTQEKRDCLFVAECKSAVPHLQM